MACTRGQTHHIFHTFIPGDDNEIIVIGGGGGVYVFFFIFIFFFFFNDHLSIKESIYHKQITYDQPFDKLIYSELISEQHSMAFDNVWQNYDWFAN